MHNCIESYIETKIIPAKADSLPETPHKASAAVQSYHSDPLHQSLNRKQSLILNRNHKSSKSSSKSSSSSSSKLKFILHHSPPSHTSYFLLKRRKTSEFNELLAEQSKQGIYRKLKILENWFELQKEQLLEKEFEAGSQAQLANLERKSHFSSDSSGNSVVSSVQSLLSVLPKGSLAIYQNPKTDKMTYIDAPFDKSQSKVTVWIKKDFLIQIIWHPNPIWKSIIRKSPTDIPVKPLLISLKHLSMIYKTLLSTANR